MVIGRKGMLFFRVTVLKINSSIHISERLNYAHKTRDGLNVTYAIKI